MVPTFEGGVITIQIDRQMNATVGASLPCRLCPRPFTYLILLLLLLDDKDHSNDIAAAAAEVCT